MTIEVVSLGKLPGKKKTLSITPEALANVQAKAKNEYSLAMSCLLYLKKTMKGYVLFEDIADKTFENVRTAMDIRMMMLDPNMTKILRDSESIEKAKNAQRELFLKYAEKYKIEGIEED